MSEAYEKTRAIAEGAANRWDKFDDAVGIEWLTRSILDFAAKRPPLFEGPKPVPNLKSSTLYPPSPPPKRYDVR